MGQNTTPAAPGHTPYNVPGLKNATSWQEELFLRAIAAEGDSEDITGTGS
ncbi:MAG: hypothetical protein H7A21_16475 [Spirochaetales bacterium]|nr:hypothetical protein [Leptospiraceae bacterium]MCP5483033.1 hypothetical protein [Spirochaetales bacterium]MCP5486161.1 hypothetical protein [Spirochaetales bacterium]